MVIAERLRRTPGGDGERKKEIEKALRGRVGERLALFVTIKEKNVVYT